MTNQIIPESPPTAPAPSSVDNGSDEISLLDLLIVLAKHKKLVIGLPLIVALVAAIISMQMTLIYTGTTRILPPQQSQSAAAAMLGQLGGLAGLAGSAGGIKNPADLYVGMLKSRTIADNLIERFNLTAVYGTSVMSEVRKALAAASDISVDKKDGMIVVAVDGEDPKLAAALANAYSEELMKFTNELAVTEASQRRVFFERQFREVKDKLTNAEIAARDALNSGGIAMVDEQGNSMVQTTAGLRAQMAAKEVSINSMKTFATERNPQLVQAQQELAAMRRQLDKMETGGDKSGAMARASGKGQGLQSVALLRDVKYYQVLFELIAKQFELAKIDEAKEGAVIQVVDKAIVPDRRTRPHRSLIVIFSTLVAGFLAVMLAFLVEEIDKTRKDPVGRDQLHRLRRYLAWR